MHGSDRLAHGSAQVAIEAEIELAADQLEEALERGPTDREASEQAAANVIEHGLARGVEAARGGRAVDAVELREARFIRR